MSGLVGSKISKWRSRLSKKNKTHKPKPVDIDFRTQTPDDTNQRYRRVHYLRRWQSEEAHAGTPRRLREPAQYSSPSSATENLDNVIWMASTRRRHSGGQHAGNTVALQHLKQGLPLLPHPAGERPPVSPRMVQHEAERTRFDAQLATYSGPLPISFSSYTFCPYNPMGSVPSFNSDRGSLLPVFPSRASLDIYAEDLAADWSSTSLSSCSQSSTDSSMADRFSEQLLRAYSS